MTPVSGDVAALLSFAASLVGALLLVVWRAAVTKTSHEIRIAMLEKTSEKTVSHLERLNDTLAAIDKHLTVKITRARSGGNFGNDDSDPPPR